jgi:V8-like Glu-specific endopeptidase
MKFTVEQREALVNAIEAAFPDGEQLDSLVSLKLGRSLESITKPGAHGYMVLKVIQWVEAHDLLFEAFMVGALNRAPENSDLQRVAKDFGLDEGGGSFEAYVRPHLGVEDVEAWRAKMMACERAVCRVEGDKYGTGFLIGPGLVITCYHVVDVAAKTPAKPPNVRLRFDYKRKTNGKTVQNGKEYSLVSGKKWLAAASPAEALDFALLRVSGKPENGSVAGQAGAPVRGQIGLSTAKFQKGDPFFVIQHPSAEPLKFAAGAVKATRGHEVVHTANTAEGSSGAPGFTSNWELIAVHGKGGDKANGAIRFAHILENLQQDKELAAELGV